MTVHETPRHFPDGSYLQPIIRWVPHCSQRTDAGTYCTWIGTAHDDWPQASAELDLHQVEQHGDGR